MKSYWQIYDLLINVTCKLLDIQYEIILIFKSLAFYNFNKILNGNTVIEISRNEDLFLNFAPSKNLEKTVGWLLYLQLKALLLWNIDFS